MHVDFRLFSNLRVIYTKLLIKKYIYLFIQKKQKNKGGVKWQE